MIGVAGTSPAMTVAGSLLTRCVATTRGKIHYPAAPGIVSRAAEHYTPNARQIR
jgi:hypothetical protein